MHRTAPLVLALALVGCAAPAGGPTPTPVPVPAARATFASPFTPTPAADAASGGLGLHRRDWEARNPGGTVRAEYRGDRVVALEQAADRFGWPLEEARRGVVQNLVPRDAAYLRTETRPDGAVVDRFASPSVGPFAAVYVVSARGRVDTYRVALGEP